MTALWVTGAIFLLLILLSFVRVGGGAEYNKDGFSVRVRFGVIWVQVFPLWRKERKKKPAKKKKEKAAPTKSGNTAEKEEPRKKEGGSLRRFQKYLPLVGEAAGMLKQRIRIDRLYLDFTAAASDAAGAAMVFGYSNMIIGLLWPVLEENFEIRDHRICTAVDFDGMVPVIYLEAIFSARLGQLISFGCHMFWKFLKIYQKEKSKKEAI